MFPGKVNPKKMKQMMKQLGMEMQPIDDVRRIEITTGTGTWVFEQADVVAMTMQGVTTYQITGEPRFEEAAPAVPDGDVQLVMEQTKASEEKVRKTLAETKGDIAEAILRLSRT
ncbi:MAG: nascent polypeptide-associated complex protein [Methanomicrobiales archaeon]|nr:nascent polypeptide-associated complex protein [Methanomicrobiales archaeon]MDD1654761.1 nascent polypeptide-associated complex protein [Methanomicrobiales archaeon]